MTVRAWLDAANELTLAAVDRIDDAGFASPSTLQNWTNAHIVAHLHFNAEAIGRLVSWARTGIETPMYSTMAQRTADIEAGALIAPSKLRAKLHASNRELMTSFDALTPPMWDKKVVTAQGRTVPATELVWMRFREVAVHGIDLGTGLMYADFPAEAVSKLVGEIVAKRLGAGEGPALASVLTGRTEAGPQLGPWL
jgi:maleylpyruvate isomerase